MSADDDEAYRTKVRQAVLAAILAEVTDEGIRRVQTELVIQALFEAIMSVVMTGCQPPVRTLSKPSDTCGRWRRVCASITSMSSPRHHSTNRRPAMPESN